jgi:hypothetical protein
MRLRGGRRVLSGMLFFLVWIAPGAGQQSCNGANPADQPTPPIINALDLHPWHLARITAETAATMDVTTVYGACSTGHGVRVYLIDSGTMREHSEFGLTSASQNTRIENGVDFTRNPDHFENGGPIDHSDDQLAHDPCAGWPDSTSPKYSSVLQAVGHGTATASLINGMNLGVAREAIVVPLRVITCRDGDIPWQPDHIYRKGATVKNNGSFRATTDVVGGTTPPSLDRSGTWVSISDEPSQVAVRQAKAMLEAFRWLNQPGNVVSPAVISLSTYFSIALPDSAGIQAQLDPVIAQIHQQIKLLATNYPGVLVIASANNQHSNASETGPGAWSCDNGTVNSNVNSDGTACDANVITVGGLMLHNDPTLHRGDGGFGQTELPSLDNSRSLPPQPPPSQPAIAPVPKDAPWLCGPGDSTNCGAESGSNYGRNVNLWAPARNIGVASLAGPYFYRDRTGVSTPTSGTSWSAPIVAGIAARFLSTRPHASAADVKAALFAAARDRMLDQDELDAFAGGANGGANKVAFIADVVFIHQPASTFVVSGSAAQLTVDAAAPDGAKYQWYAGPRHDTSNPIADGAGPAITVSPAATTSYWVRVTVSCGSRTSIADSEAARVQVVMCATPPAVSTQPAPYSEYPDSRNPAAPITLSVGVTTAGLSFQWHQFAGGSESPAGNSQSIDVRPSVDTIYWVTITAPATGCSINSEEARIVVIKAPDMPAAAEAFEFGVPDQFAPLEFFTRKTIRVKASGSNLKFQWTFRALGEVTSTTIPECSTAICWANGSGTYSVTVSNVVGKVAGDSPAYTQCTPTNSFPLLQLPDLIQESGIQLVARPFSGTLGSATCEWYEGLSGDLRVPLDVSFPNLQDHCTATLNAATRERFYWVQVKGKDSTRGTDCATNSSTGRIHLADCDRLAHHLPAPRVVGSDTGAQVTLVLDNIDPTYTVQHWCLTLNGNCTVVGDGKRYLVRTRPKFGADFYTAIVSTPEGCTGETAAASVNGCPLPRGRAIRVLLGSSGLSPTGGYDLSVAVDDADAGAVTVAWFAQDSHPARQIGTGYMIHVNPVEPTAYWAELATCGGQSKVTTESVVITCAAPVITVAPSSASANSNGSVPVDLSAHVEATGTPVYAWYQGAKGVVSNPVPASMAGQPQPLLSFVGNSVTLHSAGATSVTVWARITSCNSTVDTEAVTLTVTLASCPLPVVFSISGGGVIMRPGEGFPLSVGLDSPGNYSYQWYRGSDNQPMNGATSATFVATTSTFDSFYCVVTVTCPDKTTASVTTAKAYLWVYGVCDFPPLLTSQTLDDVPANSSDGVTFSAFVDWPSVTYQWYKGQSGDTTSPIPVGAGAPSRLTVGGVGDLPSAYWVRATLSCGASHDSATLVFSKNQCTPVVFSPEPSSTEVPYGVTASLIAETPFAKPAVSSYTWYDMASGSSVGSQQTFFVAPPGSRRYYVIASNSCSRPATSAVATVRVASCSSITLSLWPQDQWTFAGTSADLTVVASSSQLSYQWYAGEVGDESQKIQGANSPTYHTTALNASATFWVRLSNSSCVADSPTIHVSVCQPAQPTGAHSSTDQNIYPGGYALLYYQATGTAVTYQWYIGQPGDTQGSTPIGLPFDTIEVRPTANTTYWARAISQCGPAGGGLPADSPALRVSVCPQILQQPTVAIDPIMSGATATLTVGGSNDAVYHWYQGESGDVSQPFGGNMATVTTPAITADTKFWVLVSSGSCSLNSDSVTVHLCTPPAVVWSSVPHPLRVGEPFTLQITTAPAGAMLSWYRGVSGDVANSTLLAGPEDLYYYNQVLPDSPTSTYWVRVQKAACYADSPTLTLVVCAPTITQQPQAPAGGPILAGSSATLSVAATSAAVTYQWYVGDTGDVTHPIANEIGSSTIVTPTADTRYWVRVTGSCSIAADSNSVLVSVCNVPHIASTAPLTQWAVFGSGSSTTVWVNATGSNLTYQWYVGASPNTATPVAGATSSALSVLPANTISYWVRVSGSCGTPVDSVSMLINVCAPPSITAQPQPTVIWSGATATLSVTASEATTQPVTYQWYRGATGDTSNAMPMATASTFTTPALTTATSYWVRVSCSICAPADSQAATVSICYNPQVLNSPGNQFIATGQTVSLATVTGAGNVYQWYRGASGDTSQVAPGASNASSYAATPSVTTQYWAQVQNNGCISRTQTATVSVCVPTISQQPVSLMINPGASTTLSVVADTSGLSYQWYRGITGDTSTPVGTNAATFATPALTVATSYWVRVTGSCSRSTDSSTAAVTICAIPAITSNAPTTQQAVLGSGSSTTVWVNATGTNLTYQWYVGASGNMATPVAGATSSALTVTPQNVTSYWVHVSGTCGTPVNSVTMLINVCGSPSITAQPQGTIIFSGGTATLSVTASEATTQAVTYQWYRGATGDTSALVGTNSTSFTTPALTTATSYWVRVSCGTCAPADSQAATVSICPNPQVLSAPADQFIAIGQAATLTAPCCGNSYQWFVGASGSTSQPASSPSGVSSFTTSPTVTTQYWAQIQNSGCISRTLSATVNVCIPTFTQQPANVTISGGSTTLSASANTVGVTYQWYTGTSGSTAAPISGATAASVTVTPGSSTSYWVRATGSCGRTTDSSTATVTLCSPPLITNQPHDSSAVWGSGNAYLSVTATGSNLTYQWYYGNSGDTSAAISGATGSSLSIWINATQKVWVRITGQCGAVNSNAAFATAYPTISQQPPPSVNVGYNSSATISFIAQGGYLSYTWRYANGVLISTTSIPTLNTPPVVADNTSIYCEVWSGSAAVTTNSTTLIVCNGPTVSISKGSGTSCNNVFATASTADAYEWYQGPRGDTSHPISGSGSVIYVCPTVPTQYWFRADVWSSYQVVGCYSDSNAITVP